MQQPGSMRRWWVLATVSLMFFFVSGSTFSSLGIVLFTMAGELNWSMTAAGASFSVLGLACCFASPLPSLMVQRIGSRLTLVAGALLLALGFLLAWGSHSLMGFYVAMALVGTGFTLGANIPGVFLIVGWFRQRAARVIGIYLMFGAFGGVVAPPLVQALVASGGWRLHWLVMAACALVLAVLAGLAVRESPPDAAAAAGTPDAPAAPASGSKAPASTEPATAWTWRRGLATPQFAVLALAMVLTQTTVTTLNSAAVPHFLQLGSSAEFAALLLSLQALVATLAKGLTGSLADRWNPRYMLAGGLIAHAAGLLLLGLAKTHALGYLFALAFGLGWGSVYLAVTVLVMRYFGRECGTALMSTVWLLTGVAAAGPALAGWTADHYGSFMPVFRACSLLLLPLAAAGLMLRAPLPRTAHALPAVAA